MRSGHITGRLSFVALIVGQSNPLLGPNPHRRTVIFVNSGDQRITIDNSPVPAFNSGLTLTAQGIPLKLCREEWGTLVEMGWHARPAGAGGVIGILEAFDAETNQ